MATVAPFSTPATSVPDDAWPLEGPLVQHGGRDGLVTFASQAEKDWGEDAELLTSLSFGPAASGAIAFELAPFICVVPPDVDASTGRGVLRALQVRDFRSEHIETLDATSIPYPGYEPHTDNDEIHTDFAEQYSYRTDDPSTGPHGALVDHVVDGRMWYVLLHSRPPMPYDHDDEDVVRSLVLLLEVGLSTNGHLVGSIRYEACHNLCD